MSKRNRRNKKSDEFYPEVIDIVPEKIMPWDLRRDLGETVKTFRYFAYYRDLLFSGTGLRTYDSVAQKFKISIHYVAATAVKYCWKERCEAYVSYVSHLVMEKNETDLIAMHLSHIRLAKEMLDKAWAKFKTLSIGDLTPNDAIKLAELGVKMEDKAMSDIVEQPLRRRKMAAEIALLEKTEAADTVIINDDIEAEMKIKDDLEAAEDEIV